MVDDTILTKRRALYKGEIGLFADDEMAEEDIRLITMDKQVIGKWYSPATLEKQRFLWGMVYKAWQNSDLWMDHHEAMIELKKRAHFTRMKWDSDKKKMVERVRSITRINDEQLRLLTERIADVICAEIMPGMKKNDLYREIEEMVDVRPSR
jgi:hypothetical protein